MLFIIIAAALLALIRPVHAAPKEVYTDPETGHEVWRMTDYTGNDYNQYYHHPTISPDGKYLIFRTNRSPFAYIMNTDGSGERGFASISGLDWSRNNLQGWFSNDGQKYYSYNLLYEIDIAKFLNNQPASDYLRQISATHGNGFYYPMVSPDGKTLYGVGNANDITSGGGKMKFINIDGTNYREFTPPFYAAGNGSTGFDVSHGWLGPDRAWYLNNDPVEFLDAPLVFNVSDGARAPGQADLRVVDPTGNDVWYGILGHPNISPSAYMIGEGAGLVSGHGRDYKFSNSKYWTGNPIERKTNTLAPSQLASHYMFSPDAKWVSVGAYSGTHNGYVVVYPVQPNSPPVRVAKFTNNTASQNWTSTADPGFSPDGTKNIYNGDVRQSTNIDIYMSIFKKPDTPTAPSARTAAGGIAVTWRPASLHRETRQYEIHSSLNQNGTYSLMATVPQITTYINTASKTGTTETVLTVDDTSQFPQSGVIEIFGLSSEVPSELVRYTGKTATSFTGCTRGYGGTQPAPHYNDAFVWLDTATYGYTDTSQLTVVKWYKIRSVEWSGLKSDFSAPISITNPVSSTPPPPSPTILITSPTPSAPAPKPGDANGDNLVNEADYDIWKNHYKQTVSGVPNGDFNGDTVVDGKDYSIWMNNYGK